LSCTDAFLAPASYEEVLERTADAMREDHAKFVKSQLEEARMGRLEIQKTLPSFLDDVSPFADLKSSEHTSDKGQSSLEVKYFVSPF